MKRLLSILVLLMPLALSAQNFVYADQRFYANVLVSTNGAAASNYVFEIETLTYGTNITNNAGTIEANDFLAVDGFVKASKSHGYWTNLVLASPLAGNQSNAAVVNLVTGPLPNGSNLLYLKPIKIPNYDRAIGWWNLSNSWLNTKLEYSNFPSANSHGLSFWMTKPASYYRVANEGMMGISSSSSPRVQLGFTSDGSSSWNNLGASVSVQPNFTTVPRNFLQWGVGLNGITRTDTNAMWAYINGRTVSTNMANVIGTLTTTNQVGLLAYSHMYDTANGIGWATNKPIGWYAIDNGMPTNLLQVYYEDVAAMMRAFGRVYKRTPQPAFLIAGQSLAVAGKTPIRTNSYYPTTLYTGGSLNHFTSTNIPVSTRATFFDQSVTYGWRAFGEHFLSRCTNAGFNTESNQPLIMDWAKTGEWYSALKKGSPTNYNVSGVVSNVYGHSMADILLQTTTQSNLTGNALDFKAILMAHGESDSADVNYGNYLAEWVKDYQGDIASITMQGTKPPMFMWQIGGGAKLDGGIGPSSAIANTNMLWAHETSGGSNLLVGCRYFMLHDNADLPHLTATSYELQGEYMAEAVYAQLYGGGWDCLRPTNITRTDGTNFLLTFNKAGLTWETNLVRYMTNYGFGYTNELGSNKIFSVELTGANTNQVRVMTAGAGAANTHRIRYALMTATNAASIGPQDGPRGNLRDQSTAVGTVTGTNLYNYCVQFEKVVP